MILQLDPILPVVVVSLQVNGKPREGYAHFVHEMGPDNSKLWGVFMDDDGSCMWVPNEEIRLHNCWSLSRPPRERKRILGEIQQ